MQDKVVVITGAARGFGRAIAERMGRAGCHIVAWDVDPDTGQAVAHVERMDVSDPVSVETATRNTLAAMGRIDVLVNNAGVNGPTVPVWDYPLEDWRRVIAIDLTGCPPGCLPCRTPPQSKRRSPSRARDRHSRRRSGRARRQPKPRRPARRRKPRPSAQAESGVRCRAGA